MREYLNKEFLLSNKENIIKAAAAIIVVVVAFFVFVLGSPDKEDDLKISTQESAALSEDVEDEKSKEDFIMVDVGGAVIAPQVVQLKPDSRVADAIKAAGGLTDDADTEQINQAAFVTDGEKIIVPKKGEVINTSTGITSTAAEAGKIDINTATSEELQMLNGVGPATAEKILKYRTEAGYFKSIEELKNVDGIGDKTYDKLKDNIKV